jgi:hypothetical protein
VPTALSGTLGVVATGVHPRDITCHSEHVTRRSGCQGGWGVGVVVACLGLKQEVTLKHLASQDYSQSLQRAVNKAGFVSSVESFQLRSTKTLQPDFHAFSATAYDSPKYHTRDKKKAPTGGI